MISYGTKANRDKRRQAFTQAQKAAKLRDIRLRMYLTSRGVKCT